MQVNNIRSNVLQEQTHIAATEPVQTTLFTLGILAEALNNANVPFTAGEIKVYLQRIEALALSSQISLLTSDSRELNSKRKKKHFKTHDRIQILSHPEWTGNMSYHIRLYVLKHFIPYPFLLQILNNNKPKPISKPFVLKIVLKESSFDCGSSCSYYAVFFREEKKLER